MQLFAWYGAARGGGQCSLCEVARGDSLGRNIYWLLEFLAGFVVMDSMVPEVTDPVEK